MARATVADTDGDGGDDKVHKAAARNAEVASYDVALPSPLDTASEPTVVVPQPVAVSVAVVCSSPVGFVASMNQNRLIVASLLINGCSLFLSLSITENGEEQGKKESTVLERERVNLEMPII